MVGSWVNDTKILPDIVSILGQVSADKPGCMEVVCSTFQCLLKEEVMTELESETYNPESKPGFFGLVMPDDFLGITK